MSQTVERDLSCALHHFAEIRENKGRISKLWREHVSYYGVGTVDYQDPEKGDQRRSKDFEKFKHDKTSIASFNKTVNQAGKV
jgi:hypothetical protein